MSFLKATAIATAFLLAGAGAASAAQATVSLNVRSGPSVGYGVVDTLYAGEEVDVGECNSNGWCRISHTGPDGWVSARYLADTPRRNAPPPRRADNPPDINFSFSVPGFGFSIGNGNDFRDRPTRPNRPRGQVCFYEDVNYGGRSFCASPGQRASSLGPWNDRISSIRIRGDAQVQVCEDNNFGGRCAVLDQSRRNLGQRNNDIVSSYRIR